MSTSRERINQAIAHVEPDKVPFDLGGSATTGMHVSSVYLIRQALGLDEPGTPVKVIEPYQMLGEIAPDLQNLLGIDVVGVSGTRNFFGFRNEGWKPWQLWDGTPVLVPAEFNTEPEENGDILMYPEGDRSAPPSGKMPFGGFYFDTIVRQPAIDDEHLDVLDNLEEFGPITNQELEHFRNEVNRIWETTDKAILGNFGGTSFGDIALVPAPQLKYPKGIRDIAEWYISTSVRRAYVYRVFERQCEIALENLEKIFGVTGNRITAVFVTGTDFGTQQGPFISPKTYRELYKPFHIEINRWIHNHTTWKTFIHSCGSIAKLIPDMIDAGFDILNPVQVSAAGMDAAGLKGKYGDVITFWGGGVDTQHTLPEGTPELIRSEVRERMRIFGKGGGFVFNAIHNIQPRIPKENLVALFEAVQEFRNYPMA